MLAPCTVTPLVSNSKSHGTQTAVLPGVQSLKSVKTRLACSFNNHITHTRWRTYLHIQPHTGLQPLMQASYTCWPACTHIQTCCICCITCRFSTRIQASSSSSSSSSPSSSPWQPVCQSRNASPDYSLLSYSLVVVRGSSLGCWPTAWLIGISLLIKQESGT